MESFINQTITLQTSDKQQLKVNYEAACYSVYLKEIIEDNGSETIPIQNISMRVLKQVMKYCEHHKNHVIPRIKQPLEHSDIKQIVSQWDAAFINSLNLEIVFQIIQAANYLHIISLIDLGCAKMTCCIKDKSPQQIRQTFGIENDFTPQEEKELQEELAWLNKDA